MVKDVRTTPKKLAEQRGAYAAAKRPAKARASTPEVDRVARDREIEHAMELLFLLHGDTLKELAKH